MYFNKVQSYTNVISPQTIWLCTNIVYNKILIKIQNEITFEYNKNITFVFLKQTVFCFPKLLYHLIYKTIKNNYKFAFIQNGIKVLDLLLNLEKRENQTKYIK